MTNKINISCKQATFLISTQQETKLGFKNKIKLAIHIGICSVCKLFKLQSKYIIDAAKNSKKEPCFLPDEIKQKIEMNVNELIQKSK